MRVFLGIVDPLPKVITTKVVGNFIMGLDSLGPNSQVLVRAATKSFLEWLPEFTTHQVEVNWKMVPATTSIISDSVLVLSPEQITELIHDAPNIRAEAAWRLGFDIGLRVGELVKTPRKWYQPPRIKVIGGKSRGGKGKIFQSELDPKTVISLDRYLAEYWPGGDLLFPYSRRLINRELKKKLVGLNSSKP